MQALQPPAFQEYRGCFSGTVITSPEVCTATDGRPCHMVTQIPVCNELLYNVELELQEFSPGQLGIEGLDYVIPEYVSAYEIDQAFRLLSCILSNHSCLVSLHIKYWNYLPKYEEMISSSYRATMVLKRLKLQDEWLIQAVSRTLPLLTGLEELYCRMYNDENNFIESLCGLLSKSSSLTKLTLTHWMMTTNEASLFCSALSKNATLTDLSINCSCIMPEDANLSAEFAASLEKSTMVRNLDISGFVMNRVVPVKYIIDAVCRSKSLVNLSLDSFVINDEASAAIEHFLSSNCVLKSFRLDHCMWYPDEPHALYDSTNETDLPSPRIRPWIDILQNNRSLEELRLKLRSFSHSDCRAFFAELQKHTSLNRVVIEDLSSYLHARGILTCSRKRGILTCSRSSLKKEDASPPDRPDILITQCKQLSDISVWLNDVDTAWAKMTLRELNSCSHVTNLDLWIRRNCIDDGVEDLLADYIRNTNTLRELSLFTPACRRKITEALKSNSSLGKLSMGIDFTEEEAVRFATTLRSSDNIYALKLYTSKESAKRLLNHLSPALAKNYTLVSLECVLISLPLTRNFYYVRDIMRRNNDLVTNAAHCAKGNHNRRCVEALELVAKNPALVEKICKTHSVGEDDAAEILKKALGSIVGLDDYMRVSGVVKRRVSCPSGNDYKLQLSDLDEYSWHHVRRFLRVSDVLPAGS